MSNADKKFTETIFTVFKPLSRWPFKAETLLISRRSDGGVVEVLSTPQSKFAVVVKPIDELPIRLETCSMLQVPQHSAFIFSVAIDYPDIDIRINRHHVASSDITKTVKSVLEWGMPKDAVLGLGVDLSKQNEECRKNRKREFAKLILRKGRLIAPQEKAYGDLKAACLQLSDSIELLHQGKIYHDTALVTRLRALICRTKGQHPLLQRTAGELNLALIIYGNPASGPIPEIVSTASLQIDNHIAMKPVFSVDTEMDIDYWLQLKSAHVNGKPYTNNEIILAFANTEGAHYDKGIEPLVAALKKIRFGVNNKEFTLLNHYLLKVSGCVLELGRYVLNELHSISN